MSDKPVAIVTGSGTGIGTACARALAKEGFRVGLHYRKSAGSAKALQAELGDAFLLQADIADIDQVEALVSGIKEQAGRVDVLVNNAGLSINADINSMKVEQFDEQRALTRGIWYLTKRVLRQYMLRKGSGRIINISSVVGHTGNAGQIPYTMEKAAMDVFTKSLCRELAGRNILVNSVAPGFIDTPSQAKTPELIRNLVLNECAIKRLGTPADIAPLVVFLASDSARHITGQVIKVDAGQYI